MINAKGFTLIETLISIVILLLGIAGLTAVILNSARTNEKANVHLIGKELVEDEIEEISILDFDEIERGSIVGSCSYTTWGILPTKYKLEGIPGEVDGPYTYALYKGVDITKDIGGGIKTYSYTLRVSVQDDFGQGTGLGALGVLLKRLRLENYWLSDGNLIRTETIFMVSHKL